MALPTHAAWLTDYEMEMLTFPNAPHDDQVDSHDASSWTGCAARSAAQLRIRSL